MREREGRRKFLVGEPVTMLFLKHEQNGTSVATRYVVVEKRGIRFRGCCNCAFNRCIDGKGEILRIRFKRFSTVN